ncbi:hypothetical protein C0J52_25226 [Blattella germanica]|nr:hypothetical protein C0J52_25226 [Blattella germanica]
MHLLQRERDINKPCWRRARLLVASAWLLSLIFSIPILVMYQEKEVEVYYFLFSGGMTQCWLEFPMVWHWQLYVVLIAVTIFVIPAIIITGCYTLIVYTIWSKSKLLTPTTRKIRHLKS